MIVDAPHLTISGWADAATLHDSFLKNGRTQIHNLFPVEEALALQSALKRLEWRLVFNIGERHVDLHPEQAAHLGGKKLRVIKNEAKERAKTQFQYLFENYPIHDALRAERQLDEEIRSVYATFNAPEFIDQIRKLTGEPVDFCDMQATRFRDGHFLTLHDDNVYGKNRCLAFVYSLCEIWRPGWGGLLEFTDTAGNVTDAYSPRFNTLSVFKVPSDHRVSPVKSTSRTSRISLTGWFRTYDEGDGPAAGMYE